METFYDIVGIVCGEWNICMFDRTAVYNIQIYGFACTYYLDNSLEHTEENVCEVVVQPCLAGRHGLGRVSMTVLNHFCCNTVCFKSKIIKLIYICGWY